ncbi:acetyl-CoA carboxylase biotin carboxyl carrier protein [Nocardia neocaledoniensis]|uniref:acetyl-CoA carboxylase biotin carboxyl carrier protein n=1 Tax=Nocardia neocaledoniensis TaxID=236511 RepID=UPI002453786A|nr:acetyl-CoA carboxylase biotin carboxyl carrier protein subunit [Nocardia neocaledoniensis]
MTESVTSDSAARAVSPTEADHSLAVLSRHAMSVRATGSAPTSVTVANGPVSLRITWDERPAAPAANGDPAGHLVLVQTDTADAPAPAVEQPADHGAATTFPLTAETVGVFYRAPEPGAAPFVAVGDPVRAGQQVGIIEAMKLMIPVTAAREGVVAEILVDNGDAVEHGQALIVFEALR